MNKRYFIITIYGEKYEVTKTRFYLEKFIGWMFVIGVGIALIGLVLDLLII